MKRVSVLLKSETIKEVDKEAQEKSISRSAIIRQRVEGKSNKIIIDGNIIPNIVRRK